jgi:hypothetical protein
MKKILSIAVVLCLLFALMPNLTSASYAAGNEDAVTVSLYVQDSANFGDGFLVAEQNVVVEPGLAGSYGYEYAASVNPEKDVTTLDALVCAHILGLGVSNEDIAAYLSINFGFIGTAFGVESYNWMTFVNGETPNDGIYTDWGYTGLAVNEAKLTDGDAVEFYCQLAAYPNSDDVAWFKLGTKKVDSKITVTAGKENTLTLEGYSMLDIFEPAENRSVAPLQNANIGLLDLSTAPYAPVDSGAGILGRTGTDGKVTATFEEVGTYYITAYYDDGYGKGVMAPMLEVNVVPDEEGPSGEWHHITNLIFRNNPGTLNPKWDAKNTTEYTYTLPAAFSNIRLKSEVPNQFVDVTYSSGGRTYADDDIIQVKDGTKISVNSVYQIEGSPAETKTYNIAIKQTGEKSSTIASGLPDAEDLKAEVLDRIAAYELGAVKEPTYEDEWTVIALARGGYMAPSYKQIYLSNLKKVLKEKNGVLSSGKYTEYSRVVLALTALGEDPTDFAGYNLLAPLAEFENVIKQGVNGPAWALIALDSKDYKIPTLPKGSPFTQTTREKLVNYLLENQLDSGYFSLGGKAADSNANTDVTAMVLQALAPYYAEKGIAGQARNDSVEKGIAGQARNDGNDGNDGVGAAVTSAIGKLSKAQDKASASLGNAGTNAQVLSAITALGISPGRADLVKGEQTVYNALMQDFLGTPAAFRLSAASNTPNRMFTDQGFYANLALYRHLQGKNSLFDMEDGITLAKEGKIPTGPAQGENTLGHSPKTGDENTPAVYILLALCALAIAGLLRYTHVHYDETNVA